MAYIATAAFPYFCCFYSITFVPMFNTQVLTFLIIQLTRRFEYQADKFAAAAGSP